MEKYYKFMNLVFSIATERSVPTEEERVILEKLLSSSGYSLEDIADAWDGDDSSMESFIKSITELMDQGEIIPIK